MDFARPFWLGVQIGTDAEMSPRMPLVAAPAARSVVLPYTGYEGTTPDTLSLSDSAAFVVRASSDMGGLLNQKE